MKKSFIIVIVIVSLFLISIGGYFYLFKKPSQISSENQKKITHPPCLEDNEIVDYPLDPKYDLRAELPKFPIVIYVKDKNTGKEIFHFQIDNVRENYYPLETHRCNVYVVRQFNYDPNKTKQEPGYKEELWKYDYSGNGKALFLLAEKPKEFISYYDPDFRVDPQEVYVALVRGGYLPRPDYALVIRNLNMSTDDFILPRQTLLETYPELFGTFGLVGWTKIGSHFWADLFDGANEIAFLRILRDVWKLDVLPTPTGLGGAALNTKYGYFTYNTGPGWIGVEEVAQQIYDEWRKAGKKIDFYLYNLFTKEKTLLATIDDPSWSFQPQWLSDTELEYELPTGKKKIYKINE